MARANNALLFGLPGNDAAAAARRFEALFDVTLTLASRGGWFWCGPEDEKILIEANRDEDEDGPFFYMPCYAAFPLIAEVYDVADPDAFEAAILGDGDLAAIRLERASFGRAPDGGVIVERHGPAGEITVERRDGLRKPDNFMLFGLPGADLAAASQRIDALFGFPVQHRDSVEWGDYDLWDGPDFEEIRLIENAAVDVEDGPYHHWEEYAQFPLIVEVSDVADPAAYRRAILGDAGLAARWLESRTYRYGPAGELISEDHLDLAAQAPDNPSAHRPSFEGPWHRMTRLDRLDDWQRGVDGADEPRNALAFDLPPGDLVAASRRLEELFGVAMMRKTTFDGGVLFLWEGPGSAKLAVYPDIRRDADGRPEPDPLLRVYVFHVADQDAYEEAILGDAGLGAKPLRRTVWKRGPGRVLITLESEVIGIRLDWSSRPARLAAP